MFKKQPFPEVARTPSNQYSEDMVSLATRDFVDFVDVDTNSPNPNRVTKPPFQEALSSETPPHFNVVREPNQGSASCQPMSMAADLTPCQLPEPSMGNHHNYRGTTNYGAMDNQCQGQQSFKGLENVVDMSEANSDVIHDIEVYENFLTNVNLPQSVRRDDSSIRLQNIPEPQSDHRNYVSELCHRSLQPPYRPSSQPNSRPQSRRSNHGVSMARPIAADDLCAKGTSEYTILHASHQMKTKKSTGGKNHTNPAAKPHAVIDSQKRDNNGTLSDFQKFFRQAADIEEKLLDYGSKIELVESQKLQIEKLQGSNQECKAQLKALESEKDKLQKKIDKYAELSSKYKDHINQVAVSQKWLLNQARKMKDDKKAIMEASTTFAKSEAHFQNLEAMIKEAKGFRVPAIQLEKCE
jgi:hypothetical protein